MKVLRNIVAELIGLFVDDWAFALLVLVWVGLFALPGAFAPRDCRADAVLGLAVLTLVFVARKARR